LKKETPAGGTPSTPTWETLEAFARAKIQATLQAILEEEVTTFLGREKSERRAAVDATPGYRNGFGKRRKLAMSCGTIQVRRPRTRGLDERFESRVLPLFKRRTEEVADLLPELYLHGLAQGDFELALRGLLGEGAPLSASSIERLRGRWQAEYELWARRPLEDRELVYAWADGIYVRAGLERDKACLLVVIGALPDGRKEVLALMPGYRESTESWRELFRDLQSRGLEAPKFQVGDGIAGLWAAVSEVWSESGQGRCWNHKIVNVLNQLPPEVRSLHPRHRHEVHPLLAALHDATRRVDPLAVRIEQQRRDHHRVVGRMAPLLGVGVHDARQVQRLANRIPNEVRQVTLGHKVVDRGREQHDLLDVPWEESFHAA
jgi:transposase-like protein